MPGAKHSGNVGEADDLDRFVQAQKGKYDTALEEITRGAKVTHWMWYVFPQLDGLGRSETAKLYAIKNVAEARAYLRHPVLGPRLVACAEAALRVDGRSALEIFGSSDDVKKLRSSATLFAHVSPDTSVFQRLLEKYFDGRPDRRTLELLGVSSEGDWPSHALGLRMR